MNIAFVQLGSFGDNINSTLMFRPIKNTFPNCNIEVHTTDLYASAFHNNPYICKIITYPAASKSACFDLYNTIPAHVRTLKYDKVFVPAPILHQDRSSKKHPELGQNLICTFMRVLEDNGIDYEYPVQTVLRLTNQEIKRVNDWLMMRKLDRADRRLVLMEVHGESGQTFWNHHWTLATVRHLMARPTTVLISRRERTQEINQLEKEYRSLVHWVGDLTIRECAELYNRCDVFFSVSSGLSNACNTDHCRTDKIWVETVNSPTVTSAPLRDSGKFFWFDNDIAKFTAMLTNRNI